MAAFSTMALVGAAAIGAAGTVAGVSASRKAAKQQKREMDKQRTEAENLAALETTKSDTGADIALGRRAGSASGVTGAGGRGSSQTGATAKRVGGLSMKGKRPSAKLGL